MKSTFIFILLLGIFTQAQEAVKFGKVKPKDFDRTESTIDKEAAAEIISKEGYYEVILRASEGSWRLVKHVEVRVKIYDKDKAPNELMNIEIPVYQSSSRNDEVLQTIKASTYNLENGKVLETKVSRKDIFDEKVHDYLIKTKFAFPNVKNGSILEYKYEIESPMFYDVDTWYFQTDVPTLYSEFTLVYPEFFIYRPDQRGSYTKAPKNETKPSDYNFTNKSDKYIYTNVPALKDEPFVFNLNNMRSSVRYELVEYSNPGYGYENYSATWEQITKDLYNNSDLGRQLIGNGFLDEKVAKLTSGITNPIEKTQAIFQFVQQNYTWDNYVSIYADEGVRSTFKKKTGNAADINLLLTAMLLKANIKAYPVVLSTVSNGMLNFFPSKQKLNYLISSVEINDQLFLMDATEKYSKINMLPMRDLNHQGFQIRENGVYKEVSLTNWVQSEIKETATYNITEDGALSGHYIKTQNNYFALNNIERLEQDKTGFESDFYSNFDFEPQNLKIQANGNKDAIRYVFDFTTEEGITEVGNKILIYPLVFLRQKTNPFQKDSRNYPLEFGTPYVQTKTIQFTIPDGYKIESLPEGNVYQIPNKVGGYEIGYQQKENKLLAKSVEVLSYGLLSPDYYHHVKGMYKQMVESENQQIVLVKE